MIVKGKQGVSKGGIVVRKICQKALALAVSLFVSFPAPVLATLQQQFEDNLKAGWLAEKFSVPICGRFFEADDPALRISSQTKLITYFSPKFFMIVSTESTKF
ncbi:MAG: hypothetical protein EBE86_035030, partial [Hormoscilla sp. GUM202]|nr:hypothetical protein [Hormoscilla sp. GUM202]